jgi:hypothetical protein
VISVKTFVGDDDGRRDTEGELDGCLEEVSDGASSTAEAAKKGKQWCLDDFEIGKTLIRGSAYCPRPSILRDINRKSDPVPDNTKSIVDQL